MRTARVFFRPCGFRACGAVLVKAFASQRIAVIVRASRAETAAEAEQRGLGYVLRRCRPMAED